MTVRSKPQTISLELSKDEALEVLETIWYQITAGAENPKLGEVYDRLFATLKAIGAIARHRQNPFFIPQ
jgi:hypothetical protein